MYLKQGAGFMFYRYHPYYYIYHCGHIAGCWNCKQNYIPNSSLLRIFLPSQMVYMVDESGQVFWPSIDSRRFCSQVIVPINRGPDTVITV